jgi:hypothetical protein
VHIAITREKQIKGWTRAGRRRQPESLSERKRSGCSLSSFLLSNHAVLAEKLQLFFQLIRVTAGIDV